MLSQQRIDAIEAASRRLHKALRAAYLRWRIAEAEKDATVIQAECLSGPERLIKVRAWITDAKAELHNLEGHP